MVIVRMKPTFVLALAVLCSLTFSGCAMLSNDDRDFYGKGWINPKELDDQGSKMPAHPESTGGLGKSPVVDPILDE